MPQLWLTFEEIADLFGCDTADARRRVFADQWERRRHSDGLTRAQLPPEVAHEFMLRYSSKHEARGASVDEFDAAMAALRSVFSQTETYKCEEDRADHSALHSVPVRPALKPPHAGNRPGRDTEGGTGIRAAH
jgi:hypothetical protein